MKVWLTSLTSKVTVPEAGLKSVPRAAVPLGITTQVTVRIVPCPPVRVIVISALLPRGAVYVGLAKFSVPPKSLSRIVNTCEEFRPSTASGLGLDSAIVNVSFPSAMWSSTIVTGISREVTPAGNTSVPGSRMKSLPMIAVPLIP